MSDFDREAEREKLREKYEEDKKKREASERMSELLLQGATMTNRHCPECHSPVFRYDGRAFCPTCETEVTEEDAVENDEDVASRDGEASTDDAGDERTKARPETDDRSESVDEKPEEIDSPPTPARDASPARIDPPARRDRRPDDGTSRAADSVSESERAQLETAETTLLNEIVSLAHRAEETRDVGRKRDLLAAARDAAETLEAVRRL